MDDATVRRTEERIQALLQELLNEGGLIDAEGALVTGWVLHVTADGGGKDDRWHVVWHNPDAGLVDVDGHHTAMARWLDRQWQLHWDAQDDD